MGPHNRGAWESAQALGDVTLLLSVGQEGFRTPSGQRADLADFDVVWYHQGDAIERTCIYRGAPLAAIRQYARNGGGVLLSGGALAMEIMEASLRVFNEVLTFAEAGVSEKEK